ncbi:fused response regulator/thioredoxin-disulfide reductase [Terrabacter sp. Soil811]|uniref:FAD-dependent oxidoreductase n=1 Tax=Terrabacter sp. Soil811 TaxID=1736419 RepID=UPI0006FD0300|nr:FAD-dependent oxidoreductase [Terrabacter sp. Soil811]KRF46465.1 fused response regulator/thioredoxin-disulfide reductase [Terrabacter sp. Soil811]
MSEHDGASTATSAGQGGAAAVILTVDDDPEVSRSVARDLRRRYGRDYRIVRCQSGAEGLAALRELSLRGVPVALLVADYRMPQMSGIEFLEEAMDLVPSARRVLLTAYADTGAAIDAVNVVDLDHYLLKPWIPAEQLLYPVLDELLSAWLAGGHAVQADLRVVGHQWCRRTADLRDFLARIQAPYRWYPVEQPEALRLLEAAGADAARLPVVITADGQVLIAPSHTQVADALGLGTAPSEPMYDLVVVGAGPAGLAAAVYGASEGLRTLLVERTAAGGQAGQSSRIENYLGFPDGVSGAQLAQRARRQALKFGAEIVTTKTVVALHGAGSQHSVVLDDGVSVGAHAVILATGVSYRRLAGDGMNELTGRGVYYGASPRQAEDCADKDVVIVGGANSAGQAAVHFARQARSVTIVVRGPSLDASMSRYLIEQIEALENVTVRTCTEVAAAHGDEHLTAVAVRDVRDGRPEMLPTGWLFVFIGAEPHTGWLHGVLARDRHGFIIAGPDLHHGLPAERVPVTARSAGARRPADPAPATPPAPPAASTIWPLDRAPYHLETSLPGVFVCGDARAQSGKRVASAVGEGAMAVMLVHRYLAQP